MPGEWKRPVVRRGHRGACYADNGHPLWAIGVAKGEGELAVSFTDQKVYEYRNVDPAAVVTMLADPLNSGCVFLNNMRWNPNVQFRRLYGEEVKAFTWTLTGRPLVE